MLVSALVLVGLVSMAPEASGVALPPDFTQSTYGTGLGRVTSMAFAPDGRLFVSSQDGHVRIVKDGATLPTPFMKIPTDDQGERGMTGLALDPDFAANHFVYIFYATP